jgi:hypothetical protein
MTSFSAGLLLPSRPLVVFAFIVADSLMFATNGTRRTNPLPLAVGCWPLILARPAVSLCVYEYLYERKNGNIQRTTKTIVIYTALDRSRTSLRAGRRKSTSQPPPLFREPYRLPGFYRVKKTVLGRSYFDRRSNTGSKNLFTGESRQKLDRSARRPFQILPTYRNVSSRRIITTFAGGISVCSNSNVCSDGSRYIKAIKMDEDTQNQGGYRRHHLYHGIIVDLFSFIHQQPYTKEMVFSADQLRDLRPGQIVQWMCKKVYGVTDPTPGDQPTHGRSASLEYYKKAIFVLHPQSAPPVGCTQSDWKSNKGS